MSGVNKCMFLGNLTRDPDLQFTPAGTAVCKFSLAINRQYKGSDGAMKKETEFVNIVVWGKSAENCGKFLIKGSQAFVEGRMQTRSYEKDGQKKYATEIIADQVTFVGGGGQRREAEPGNAPAQASAEDDLPF